MKELKKHSILEIVERLSAQKPQGVSSKDILLSFAGSSATLKRHLEVLVKDGELICTGKARSTRYRLPGDKAEESPTFSSSAAVFMSPKSLALRESLSRPLASRTPVTYQRRFVDQYRPNETFLLSKSLADQLAAEGRMKGQQPAGTYARKVLEQLLIDLSWSSSNLEGNRFTLLATKELFEKGAQDGSADAVMLLNHKRAIEFMVDSVPLYGLAESVIRNLHALLMQDLLSNQEGLGAIRKIIVNISDTVYVPTQVSTLLEEMLGQIVEKAKLVKNPVEAAFFLWINLAYLQPFEDGNKRTSRLAANIPLMIYNCAPLSFLNVEAHDYAQAMMGVYEYLNTSLAEDLFAWTYRRSIQKYSVVMESLGAPDPFRLKYRDKLSEAVQLVIRERQTIRNAMQKLNLPSQDIVHFTIMLENELASIAAHNCARHRLAMAIVEGWISDGRPR